MEKSSFKVDYSKEIGNAVFNINAHYTDLQNRTKVYYFTYLKQGKSVEDFSKQVEKLWSDIDHKFMDEQIKKLQELIHKDNVKMAVSLKRINGKDYLTFKDQKIKINDEFFKLVPESEFNKFEKKFMNRVIKDYEKKKKTIDKKKGIDKDEYLDNMFDSYDERINQVVAYYNQDGKVARYTQLSSYLSMLHNVDLTRSGWNQTLADADYLGMNTFIIPYHPFSCPECLVHQNVPLSRNYVVNVLGIEAEEQVGDILHPNCKCTLSILWDDRQIQQATPDFMQEQENYKIRQKVNGISLTINKLEVDRDIAKKLGNWDLVDNIDGKIYKLSIKEKELVNRLPSDSLKRQVVAINR